MAYWIKVPTHLSPILNISSNNNNNNNSSSKSTINRWSTGPPSNNKIPRVNSIKTWFGKSFSSVIKTMDRFKPRHNFCLNNNNSSSSISQQWCDPPTRHPRIIILRFSINSPQRTPIKGNSNMQAEFWIATAMIWIKHDWPMDMHEFETRRLLLDFFRRMTISSLCCWISFSSERKKKSDWIAIHCWPCSQENHFR